MPTATLCAEILRGGGNAFDAAVAGALSQGVTDPHRSGIGGFGVATLYEAARGRAVAIAYHGRAGLRVRPDQWAADFEGVSPDGFGFLVKGKVNDVGPASIAVPGVVRGLGLLHAGRGRLAWKALLERVAAFAEEGLRVPAELAAYWRRPGLAGRVATLDRLALTPAGRKHALRPDREPYAEGEVLRLPGLASAYRRLAVAGPDDFYEGEMARTLLRELGPGLRFDAKDLASYRACEEPCARIAWEGMDLFAPGPPAGGVTLFQFLLLAARRGDLSKGLASFEVMDSLGRLLSRIHEAKLRTHGDPAFGGEPVERLLSDAYLSALADSPWPEEPKGEEQGTTQLCVVDGEGNAVSLNTSLGFNSGVFSEKYGFPFNNAMQCFDPRPGQPDCIQPGRARYTGCAPTLGTRGGRIALVIGAPGGARITAAIGIPLIGLAKFGMTPPEAMEIPRFDGVRRTILFEGRVDEGIEKRLAEAGWTPRRSARPYGAIGRTYCLWLGSSGWEAGLDPSEPGALVVA